MASTSDSADVSCPACGKQYAVYYSRQFSQECETALAAVRATLLEHHVDDASPAAHPSEIFNVPAWGGAADMSAAALLSNAPVSRVSTVPDPERLVG